MNCATTNADILVLCVIEMLIQKGAVMKPHLPVTEQIRITELIC